MLVPTRGVKTAQCYMLTVWTEPKVGAGGGVGGVSRQIVTSSLKGTQTTEMQNTLLSVKNVFSGFFTLRNVSANIIFPSASFEV